MQVAQDASCTMQDDAPTELLRGGSDSPQPLSCPQPEIRTKTQQIEQLWETAKKRAYKKYRGYTALDWLGVVLPCTNWLRTYRREYILSDIVAGVTVGFLLVPQSMSYANLAGLPAVFGLYGSWLPLWLYAAFGSCRQLGVGPVAVTSMLIGERLPDVIPGSLQISNHNQPTAADAPIQEAYNTAAIQLSFLVACLYTAVGLCRLGFLTNFLSKSVIGGFTCATSIIIGLSQVKYIVGYGTRPQNSRIQEYLSIYFEEATNFVWQEFLMGMSLLGLMIFMKQLGDRGKKKYPILMFARPMGPILAVVIGLICVIVFKVDEHGIKIVGNIPSGLPPCTISLWAPMPNFSQLIKIAVLVMLVDLMESTSIARSVAAKNRYELVPNQEIIGLGIANFAGSAFSSYTATGSFSRTAVNNETGAKTQLAGFITGLIVMFVLLFLTSVFKYVPMNVMGAMIISAVSGLFEYEQPIYLFRTNFLDFCVWCTSFLMTLFVSVEVGLGTAVILALLFVVYDSAFPHMAVMGRVPGTTMYRDVCHYPEVQRVPGIMMVRVDAPIYFANYQGIKERLAAWHKEAEEEAAKDGVRRVRFVMFDLMPVSHIDAAGQLFLLQLKDAYLKSGLQLVVCNPGKKVMETFTRVNFIEALGREWLFVSVHAAVTHCTAVLEAEAREALVQRCANTASSAQECSAFIRSPYACPEEIVALYASTDSMRYGSGGGWYPQEAPAQEAAAAQEGRRLRNMSSERLVPRQLSHRLLRMLKSEEPLSYVEMT